MRIALALLLSLAASTLLAQVASVSTNAQPVDPKTNVIRVQPDRDEPARVRIAFHLLPFRKVTTRNAEGEVQIRHVAGRKMTHMLRARIERSNHFYFGDWHIETVPQSFVSKEKKYKVRLRVLRRYGATKKLEETIGTVDVSGILAETGRERLYILHGSSKRRFYNKHGHPIAEVAVGTVPPQRNPKPPVVARKRSSVRNGPASRIQVWCS